MKILIIIFIASLMLGPSLTLIKHDEDIFTMSHQEYKCIKKCNAQMKAAMIVDFLDTKCFCGTKLDFLKKVYPKKYKEKLKQSRRI